MNHKDTGKQQSDSNSESMERDKHKLFSESDSLKKSWEKILKHENEADDNE